MIKNETNMWSRNGIFAMKNLMNAKKGIERTVPQNAAVDVVHIQNIPNTKIAVTPGLIIPVYSRINWNARSMFPGKGATTTVKAMAATPEPHPTATSLLSEAFLLI